MKTLRAGRLLKYWFKNERIVVMSLTPAEIDIWLTAPSEDQHLEFKEAREQFSREKMAEYCVAIANEGGGNLVLGVSDKSPRHVVGTIEARNPTELEKHLFDLLGFRVGIEVVEHPKGRVVVCHIPERPRGTAYHLHGKYLMRAGSSLVPMSEDRLRAIFAEGEPNWLEGSALQNIDAQTVIDMLDTQAFFDLLGLPYPTERLGVLERLLKERLIDNAAGGLFSIRRLGAVLFAKDLSRFDYLSRKAPRVVVYLRNSKLETKLDYSEKRGYAVCFQDLIRFVMGQLPQNEVIEDALRKDVKLVPEIVIRELIANALVHQDFSVTGASVMIEVYNNRLVISNPGEPMVPVERFIDEYRTRNERLADLMRRMNICEEKSSGIDKVVTAAELFQLPAPNFEKQMQRTVVTIFGAKPFATMDRDDRIRACYQHCVLKWVRCERMTNQTLRQRFHLPEGKSAIVSQIITLTVEAGLIKSDEAIGGSRKFARYKPFWG